MTKKTKMFLGLGAVAVALYLVLKPKGSKGQKPCANDEVLVQVQCINAPCPPICVKKSDTNNSSPNDSPNDGLPNSSHGSPKDVLPMNTSSYGTNEGYCADDEIQISVQCIFAPCPPPRCEKKSDLSVTH